MIEAKVSGGRVISAGFRDAATVVSKEERAVVRRNTLLLETRIKAKASGRPGPNAPTGDYRRSWNHRLIGNEHVSMGEVGTNAPQGQRLENGFVGTDSLGRTYAQPPYEHVGPACDEIEPLFLADMKKLVPK